MTDLTVADVRERLEVLHQRIEGVGGSLERTRVLAVTKTFGSDLVRVALEAGLTELGENYGQELESKASEIEAMELSVKPQWHFIGGLQRNKVKRLAAIVSVWQTIDRDSLADEVVKRAPAASIMIQVNTTDEEQKSGLSPADAPRLVDRCRGLGLQVRGLMTIGPTDGSDPSPGFALLRELGEELELPELSMGMSGDLERAVVEGSTMIRVGTALFGPRTGRSG